MLRAVVVEAPKDIDTWEGSDDIQNQQPRSKLRGMLVPSGRKLCAERHEAKLRGIEPKGNKGCAVDATSLPKSEIGTQ